MKNKRQEQSIKQLTEYLFMADCIIVIKMIPPLIAPNNKHERTN